MPPPILHPLTSSIADNSTAQSGWKLNQQLLATVVNGADGSQKLRINGNLYSPVNHLNAESGQTLTLTVKSLSPFVELALANTTKTAQRSESNSGIILSESIRQWSGQNPQANATSLARFVALLGSLNAQQLPPATTALIAAMVERIIAPRLLADPRTLKSALLSGSLLIEGASKTGAASQSGKDLNSLLMQLVRSLEAANKAKHGLALQDYGLAQYLNAGRHGTDIILLLLRELGRDLTRMVAAQEHSPETPEECEHRWVFELPVNFQDRVRSVYLRILKRKRWNKRADAESVWTAKFEFELPKLGDLRVEITIEDLVVAVEITCTSTDVAALLLEKQETLGEMLEAYGLRLSGLQCTATSVSEFNARRSSAKKVAAVAENVPLSDFEMRENARERNPINGIPEVLYCAMASVFNSILEIEED